MSFYSLFLFYFFIFIFLFLKIEGFFIIPENKNLKFYFKIEKHTQNFSNRVDSLETLKNIRGVEIKRQIMLKFRHSSLIIVNIR